MRYNPDLFAENGSVGMDRLLLLMPEHFAAVALPIFRNELTIRVEITTLPPTASQERIDQELAETTFLVFTNVEIRASIIGKAPHLKFIQKWGAGTDGIDLIAAYQAGIRVSNAPGKNAVAAAEHFFALLLSLAKHVIPANIGMREHRWCQAQLIAKGIIELRNKILGLVGIGSIGRAIAIRARAFDMSVLYTARHQLPSAAERDLGIKFATLESLVRTADIVGLAVPLSSETRELFTYDRFCTMKQSSLFINVSRGAIVREPDLELALREHRIAGAGLDVFEHEPPKAASTLLTLHNVVATPHIAGRTQDAMAAISQECAANVNSILCGRQPRHLILPSLMKDPPWTA